MLTNSPLFSHLTQSSSASSQDKALVEKLRTELSRLKQHLIQIEEDYTNELVEVQQREASLEQQLIKANAEVEQLTHRLNNTGPLVAIRAQAEQALDERDQVLQRCSKLEDEVQRSQASLANLQLVIERMQKGKHFVFSSVVWDLIEIPITRARHSKEECFHYRRLEIEHKKTENECNLWNRQQSKNIAVHAERVRLIHSSMMVKINSQIILQFC